MYIILNTVYVCICMLCTCFIHVYTYLDCYLTSLLIFQHTHIENIKTVANLTNNKDVFMCILRFHASAGYLQHYETLLKELNEHPASDSVPADQYEVECASLADRNLNVPCESGICFPSYMVMLLRRSTQYRLNPLGASVITLDNATVRQRGSFVRRHLFIPAGMVTMGGVSHHEQARADEEEALLPAPHQPRAE